MVLHMDKGLKRRVMIQSTVLMLLFSMLFRPLPASAQASAYQFYYEPLNSYSREIYNLLASNVPALMEQKSVSLSKDMTEAEYEKFAASIGHGVESFLRDHPEIFWSSGWRMSGKHSWRDGESIHHYKVDLFLITSDSWSAQNGRSISADASTVMQLADTVAMQAREAGDRRYDQLLWAHNWLTRNNTYNRAAAAVLHGGSLNGDSTPWTPLAALDMGLSPVCEGYARAFQMICQRLAVPCVLVSSENHMWNYVQMEDQQWYAVDVTYDDPVRKGSVKEELTSGQESQQYFLVGSQTLHLLDQGGDHREDGQFLYPTLNTADYDLSLTETAPVAYPSAQSVEVDGVPVALQMYALKDGQGNSTNYVKLRDIALILSTSPARFGVSWNSQANVIELTSGAVYQQDGSEMSTPFSGEKTYLPSTAETWINGIASELEAILLQDDAGNGYTYYKLRDLGAALGFVVDWSNERGICVNTDLSL